MLTTLLGGVVFLQFDPACAFVSAAADRMEVCQKSVPPVPRTWPQTDAELPRAPKKATPSTTTVPHYASAFAIGYRARVAVEKISDLSAVR
jgi:hypothetical protein